MSKQIERALAIIEADAVKVIESGRTYQIAGCDGNNPLVRALQSRGYVVTMRIDDYGTQWHMVSKPIPGVVTHAGI